jgi:Lhr-like helicase
MTKEKLINWICNDYITNIKHNNWEEEDWYYLIEKAFNLNNMSLEELKKISDMIEGYWLKEVYYFYSKKEAIKLFKNLKKEQIKLLFME